MDIRELRTFLVCAEHENFTRAAEELAYVQSTVTAQVKHLEQELGVPLFDRVGRGVVLTPAGHRLATYATKIIAMVEEAAAAVAFEGSEPHGDLTISATETLSTFHLPNVLLAFQKRYPDVRLFLHPHDPRGLIERVVAGEASAAITLDAPLRHPDLEIRTVREEEVVLLGPAGHALAGRDQLEPADLAAYRLLLSELDASYGGAFLSTLTDAGVSHLRPMQFSSVAAIKQCVRTGMGLTALPTFACEAELAAGELVVLPYDCPPVFVQTMVNRNRWLPPAAAALLDLTEELLGRRP